MPPAPSDLPVDPYSEGFRATAYAQGLYSPGSTALKEWHNGFVDRSVAQGTVPADAPSIIQGRVAFRLGHTIYEHPETESMSGPWVSGWLDERTRRLHAGQERRYVISRPS